MSQQAIATRDEALRKIEAAFAGMSRPTNDELRHERTYDVDLWDLFEIESWTDMTDDDVTASYSALSFLSPAGFRYFIPAYMRFVLLNPDSSAAAVDFTVWALHPGSYDEARVRAFAISKYELLDTAQRDAVVAFLEAMELLGHPDAEAALGYWRSND